MKRAEKEAERGTLAIDGEQISFSIVRSRKRKRTIAFKMENDASLRVLVPFKASTCAVIKVLQKRASWILREKEERQKGLPQDSFTEGSLFPYLGYPLTLHITHDHAAKHSCLLLPNILRVNTPIEDLSAESLKEETRLEILLWLKKRARVKFKKRLDLWSQKMGVTYKKLIVSGPERRWGSCSVDNVIRLNWRLMMAPLPIIDYVVIHELAHIKHKDHSARFWGFVAQILPDYLKRRKILRQLERKLVI